MTLHTEIEYAIGRAGISTGSALEGDCGAIARALKAVFGGEYVIVVDSSGNTHHAAIRIDGKLYRRSRRLPRGLTPG